MHRSGATFRRISGRGSAEYSLGAMCGRYSNTRTRSDDLQAKMAELLGVSRRTIYNRIREGRLQTIRTLGGSQRVLIDSVQEDRSIAADHPSRHSSQ